MPAMAEISAVEPNGFTVASSFSGAGGSSTGYRMAGYRVAWASEFVPAAADTYRANAAPGTVLDTRDIRDVKGAEILAACGLETGELDLWDGSPPCASFSMAGNRADDWGKVKPYSGLRQRTDDLFFEYSRLLGELQPRAFIAENVPGLAAGQAKGMFKRVHAALTEAGYKVRAVKLDASWLGVPQARRRIFFLGVRNDLPAEPAAPDPLPYQYTVRDALPWILMQGDNGGFGHGSMRPADKPSPTFAVTVGGGNAYYPPSRVLVHDTSGERGQGDVTDQPAPTITPGINSVNSHHFQIRGRALDMTDAETGASLVISSWAPPRQTKRSKRDVWRPDPGAHPGQLRDGEVCRKLNLAELRALSGFPPDFVLTGDYPQRWERIGRAVPPVMMMHLAGAVRDKVLAPLRERGII